MSGNMFIMEVEVTEKHWALIKEQHCLLGQVLIYPIDILFEYNSINKVPCKLTARVLNRVFGILYEEPKAQK